MLKKHFAVCLLQADDSDDEPADSEAAAYDYLLPFLPPGMASVGSSAASGSAGSLTREQALAVRERCLLALKDRLIERANIIQVRLWWRATWGCVCSVAVDCMRIAMCVSDSGSYVTHSQ